MRPPDDRDLEDEIRSALELSIQERIERGEDPESARRAALEELGSLQAVRDSMHRVWYSRWSDAMWMFLQEMRIGLRSLLRTRGLAITVIVTLALGIGANAAIFSVVRSVLLRPLVNREADRLLYIRQTAWGIAAAVAASALLRSTDRIVVTGAEHSSTVSYDAEVRLRGPLQLLDPLLRPGFRVVAERAAAGLARALSRRPPGSGTRTPAAAPAPSDGAAQPAQGKP